MGQSEAMSSKDFLFRAPVAIFPGKIMVHRF